MWSGWQREVFRKWFPVFLALSSAACEPPVREAKRPNVVLVTIDTLRQDHVSNFNMEARPTPNLDLFASQGASFLEAYCDVTWTTPSMVTTMLGIYAVHHGFRTTYQSLEEHHLTLAEMLSEDGYATAAIIGSYPLSSAYNLDQGFDSYDDEFHHALVENMKVGDAGDAGADPTPREGEDDASRLRRLQAEVVGRNSRKSDAEVTDAALAKLGELSSSDRPFFLWVHYFGPHHIPDSQKDIFTDMRRHLVEYPGRVGTTDAEFGRLLAALNREDLFEETLVIVHSDHGESLGEHDYIGHGRYLYQDNLRVPLMIRWPQVIPAAVRSKALVGNVDITPTVLDAALGVPASRPFDGVSLLSITAGRGSGHRQMYMETYAPTLRIFAEPTFEGGKLDAVAGAARFGVLAPPLKYIVTEPRPIVDAPELPRADQLWEGLRRRELYDYSKDPGELTDVFPSRLPDVRRLSLGLDHFRRGGAVVAPTPVPATPEHLQKLRSLGYAQ